MNGRLNNQFKSILINRQCHSSHPKALPKLEDVRIAIAVAEWNGHITSALRDGAVSLLKSNGLKDEDIAVVSVPGAVELTFAASKLIETGNFDAVIIIGCVIKGDTPHFDYVCQSVTQGMTSLNADCDIPVIFGVLTVNEEQQALDRAGGALGNKGTEAAETALKMVALNRAVDEL
ncbi:MAG: 6,7-dimethyl-8-ribityllumazine synthase [Duncaniella sp.]|nr:6,7-dimethyl-8-ribityllumazine synthase [Duncaniella sp.]